MPSCPSCQTSHVLAKPPQSAGGRVQGFNPIFTARPPPKWLFCKSLAKPQGCCRGQDSGPNQRMGARGGWWGDQLPSQQLLPWSGGVHSDEGLMAIGRLVGGWPPHLFGKQPCSHWCGLKSVAWTVVARRGKSNFSQAGLGCLSFLYGHRLEWGNLPAPVAVGASEAPPQLPACVSWPGQDCAPWG